MSKFVIKLLSPAKVNLGLWLLGKRDDGYHEIFTIYHTVSLFDEVFIKEGPLKVETSNNIPQEENLVYKALRLMERRLGKELEFSVYIHKNIPQGAGLGGGSSNCALVLKAINSLLGEPLSIEELKEIAQSVSSDAVFFLYGGTAVGRGRGEAVEPIRHVDLKITLIYPNLQVSTRRVYSMVSHTSLTPNLDSDKIIQSVLEGRFEVLENRLGELAMELFPEMREVYRFVEYLGYRPMISGSGSCIFYIGEASQEVKKGALLRGWKLYQVRSYDGV
ncbi:4-diphosphocytidyl-2-C-methyl-D-erythritol kinase [Hydrogenobacter hydrogenophilus]|uniref:4-diphosphocytidyl-2-C-methyl-D-erythritol kinase n=1 Tax=Hydrogenobacter hydrogenophilus TaxID=35835 RepID=A0A285NSW7_9AQUI|nr:4-diphosphocytidyl-2-C-methyl-D-erythritol kinase [Hydrogenobacter hydrogenophilus]